MTTSSIQILLIEDNPGDARLISELLKINHQQYVLRVENNLAKGIETFNKNGIDIVLLDLNLPDSVGVDTFHAIKRLEQHKPIIILSDREDEELAIETMKSGAQDYLVKGTIDTPILDRSIRYAIERNILYNELNKELVEHEKAERALKKERNFSQSLVEAANVLIVTLDKEANIIDMNKYAYKQTGYEKSEVLNKNWIDLFIESPERHNLRTKLDEILNEDLNVFDCEYEILCKDRSRLLISWSCAVLRNSRGKIKGILSIGQDITEKRKAVRKLHEMNVKLRAIIESTNDIEIFSLDNEYRYTNFNSAHYKDMKAEYGMEIHEGINALDFISDENVRSMYLRSFKRVNAGQHSTEIICQSNSNEYLEYNWSPLFSEEGVIGINCFINNITEQVQYEKRIGQSLKEKNIMLKEIHHRVKNNLQIISSLLNLQARTLDNKEAKIALKESQSRVKSISLVYEKLHNSGMISRINLGVYLETLTKEILRSFKSKSLHVDVKYDLSEILVDSTKAVPCGLVAHEIITNSILHGFSDRSDGEIYIGLKGSKENIELILSDNGDSGSFWSHYESENTMGIKLIKLLVEEQLNGELSVIAERGLKYNIKFRGNSDGC